MSSTPAVSIVVIVRNGMPYIQEAMASLTKQDCMDFEVIVQDAASTDGTTEYLNSIRGLDIHIDSRPDRGQAHGYNRGFAKCRGSIIGTVDADNWLEPTAVSTAIRIFENEPTADAFYGSFNIVDENGKFVEVRKFPPFGRMAIIENTLVPPFGASFFNKAACAQALVSDERIKYCQDFGFWLRLSDRKILRVDDVICSVRSSPQSGTCHIELYDQYCLQKLTMLDAYLEGVGSVPLRAALRRMGRAGIYRWAAESALVLSGEGDYYRLFRDLAEEEDRGNPRITAIDIGLRTGHGRAALAS
jgi:glycosyltransferase involved in cell wall biosynthesis